MKIKILLVVIFSISYVNAQTADKDFLLGNKFGISAYYDYNIFSVDLRQFSTVADSVPRSANGSNTGFAFGGFYEYRFTERTSLMNRVIFSFKPAKIDGTTPETLSFKGNDTLGWSRHILETDLTNIKIEPIIKYRLFSRFSLYGGLNVGLRFDKTFTHDEEVFLPEDAEFLEGGRIRKDVDLDKVDDFGLQAALVLGFSVDIPLNYNGQYLLIPEVMFHTGFSDISNGVFWDINTMRAGLSFMYSENPTVFHELKEIRERKENVKVVNKPSLAVNKETLKKGEEYIRLDSIQNGFDLLITENVERVDTLFFPEKSKITTISIPKGSNDTTMKCLKVYDVAYNGEKMIQKYKLKSEEFLSTAMQPLLTYIFFEGNSAQIPGRYVQLNVEGIHNYKIDNYLKQGTFETYYHILNIIGQRMQEHSEAEITLTGCNSADSIEISGLELSKQRAENIKTYLVDIWGIEQNRIKINARNLPLRASNVKERDGIEENRRVEITSSIRDVIAPVILSDTLKQVSPKQVWFFNNSNQCVEVDKWNLNVFQSEDTLITFRGSGNVPERLIWRVAETKRTIPKKKMPVEYKLNLYSYSGKRYDSHVDTIDFDMVTVEEKKLSPEGDKRVDSYSLILFDYNKSDIDIQNKNIISYINNRIEKNSKVMIYGYSDRVGEEEYNLSLSQKRAGTVAKMIKHTKDVKFKGLGESELIYNNEFPEGRFYCRTVRIIVETPLEEN